MKVERPEGNMVVVSCSNLDIWLFIGLSLHPTWINAAVAEPLDSGESISYHEMLLYVWSLHILVLNQKKTKMIDSRNVLLWFYKLKQDNKQMSHVIIYGAMA